MEKRTKHIFRRLIAGALVIATAFTSNPGYGLGNNVVASAEESGFNYPNTLKDIFSPNCPIDVKITQSSDMKSLTFEIADLEHYDYYYAVADAVEGDSMKVAFVLNLLYSSIGDKYNPKLSQEYVGYTKITSSTHTADLPYRNNILFFQVSRKPKSSAEEEPSENQDTSGVYKFAVNAEGYKFYKNPSGKRTTSETYLPGKAKKSTKPVVTATATNNSVKLKWKAVDGAEKYAVYKMVNGKAKLLTETTKKSLTIKKLKPDKEYQYVVSAYVNGKWTTKKTSDIVTIRTEK